MLQTSSRKLLSNGCSLLVEEEAANVLVRCGTLDGLRVDTSVAAKQYELMYGKQIIISDNDDVILPPEDIKATDTEVERMLSLLSKQRDDTNKEEHDSRVEFELDFFMKYNKLDFLCSLVRLIDKFKHENVVWGVGRGSSCASYILYLLGVHDINPIKYDIQFVEFSKANY